jgi:hypothetical protein
MSSEPLILTPREADLMVAEKICKWARIDEEMPRYTTSVDLCIEAAGKLNELQRDAYGEEMRGEFVYRSRSNSMSHRFWMLQAPARLRVAAMLSAVLGREVRIAE